MGEPAHSFSLPQYGWLAAVVPSSARRFRTSDTALATVLASAGAEIVSTNADVEIADSLELHADAPITVVSLDATQPEGGGRAKRALRRLVAAARVSVLARRAAAEVERRGYTFVKTMRWEILEPLPMSGGILPPRRLRAAEHLPQRALVIGSHRPVGPTILDAVAAGAESGGFHYGRPIASSRNVVAIGDEAVLRVTIGPGSRSLEAQFRALDALRTANPPDLVAARVPWILRHGRLGLADWSLERRLPGNPHPATLGARLLEECVEFLVELFQHGDGRGSAKDDSIVRAAEAIAGVAAPKDAALITGAGREIAAELTDVPRGFAHGDFWNGNLLTHHGRLVGVVDWDRGEPNALPLIDLIHLRLTALRWRTREYMGEGIARHLVPWARAGGDDLTRSYCRQAEMTLAPRQLESLIMAYWLLYVANELTTYADRSRRPAWMQKNVEAFVRTVSTSASRAA